MLRFYIVIFLGSFLIATFLNKIVHFNYHKILWKGKDRELYLGAGLGIWIMFGIIATVYFSLPILFHFCPLIQRHMIFMNLCQWSFGKKFFDPNKHGIRGGRDFSIVSEPGLNIGVWHILPKSYLAEDNPDMDALLRNSKYPIVIYFHGNMGSRATTHRVDLYSLLQDNDCHVLAFDYRGFGNSTSITPPTETGLVNDSLAVYEWVREKLGDESKIPVYFWGHSLGTGVSVHLSAKLSNEKKIPLPAGLILEAPFTNMGETVLNTITTIIFRPLPAREWIFASPLKNSDLAFQNDVFISNVQIPILILHDKLDLVVPYEQGKKLFEIASAVSPDSVYMKTFMGNSRSSAHVFICKEPELIEVLNDFMTSCSRKSKR